MRFTEFKLTKLTESILDEVSMSPTSLQRWADSADTKGMLMGIEFEMCVPLYWFDDHEPILDYDYNPAANSIEDILEFFADGDGGIQFRYQRDESKKELKNLYYDWVEDKLDDYIIEYPDKLVNGIFQVLMDELDTEEYMPQAISDLGDEDHPALLRYAHGLKREEVLQIIEDKNDSLIYDEARNKARGIIAKNMKKQDLLDEKDWLHDINVDVMSEAQDLVANLTWPYMDEADGGNISEIADDFAAHISEPVHYNTDYHGGGREKGQWIVEPDSSIDCDDHYDLGLEFISPPQEISETLRQMEELYSWADKKNCYTNSTTGLHMNISVPNFSIDKLDFIKLALFMGDKYILAKFDRLTNTYCRSATDIITKITTFDQTNQLLIKMREHLTTAASKMIHDGLTAKYTSINTQDGYVEFRGPGGDYLNKSITELTSTALRLAMALNIACDEDAHKEEYAKKLYKLVSDRVTNATNKDSVDLFVNYASSNMGKAELKAFIKQRQIKRAFAKSIAAQKRGGGSPLYSYTITRTSDPTQVWTILAPTTTEAIRAISAKTGIDDADFVAIRNDTKPAIPPVRTSPGSIPGMAPPLASRVAYTQPRWHVTNRSTGQSSTISAEDEEAARDVVRDMTSLPSADFIFTRAHS